MAKKAEPKNKVLAPKVEFVPNDYSEITLEDAVKLLHGKDALLAEYEEVIVNQDSDATISDEDKKIVLDKKLAAIGKIAVNVKGEFMASVMDSHNGKSIHDLTDDEYDELLAFGTVFSLIE